MKGLAISHKSAKYPLCTAELFPEVINPITATCVIIHDALLTPTPRRSHKVKETVVLLLGWSGEAKCTFPKV